MCRRGGWPRVRQGRGRLMSEQFYSDARLYDGLFPAGERALEFYRASPRLSAKRTNAARRWSGCAATCATSTGPHVRPRAHRGHSLLHLHAVEDLASCLRSVRRHLAPGGRLVLDVFNPSVRMLAGADGVRRAREALGFWDPERGDVSVDVSETYDAAAQVTRGTWFFSAESEPDYVVAPLELRSVFPYRTTSGGESRLQPPVRPGLAPPRRGRVRRAGWRRARRSCRSGARGCRTRRTSSCPPRGPRGWRRWRG